MLGENARARLSYPVSLSPFCMSMCVQKRNRIHSSLVVPSDFFSVPARPLFLELRRIPRNFRTPSEHTSELNHSGARIICTGILRNPEFRREGPRTWYFVPHVTNIYYEDTKKKVSMMAFCRQLLLLLHPAASRYAVLPSLLPLLDQRQ